MSDDVVAYGRIRIDPTQMKAVLSQQRARLGMTHRAVAEKAGVAPATVFNLEQGNYKVQLDKFLAILGALDLLPEHVLAVDGDTKVLPPSRVEQEIKVILETCTLDEALIRLGQILRQMQ